MDIHLGLEKLGMIENYASDCSTYETMVATWRDSSIPILTKADLQAASDTAVAAYKYKQKMDESDNLMPRYLEDLITDKFAGDAGTSLQERYDKKIKIRGERP